VAPRVLGALAALVAVGGSGVLAAGCERAKPAEVVGEEREDFVKRCDALCTSTGFQGGQVKEIEIVGETITRACYCASGGRLTPEPKLTEKGPR
jgi:hypothetical protein